MYCSRQINLWNFGKILKILALGSQEMLVLSHVLLLICVTFSGSNRLFKIMLFGNVCGSALHIVKCSLGNQYVISACGYVMDMGNYMIISTICEVFCIIISKSMNVCQGVCMEGQAVGNYSAGLMILLTCYCDLLLEDLA